MWHRKDDVARLELETAERLLSRCSGAGSAGAAQVQSGAARKLMQRLQAAYADMWQLQLREGLAELLVRLHSHYSQQCYQKRLLKDVII